MTISLTFPMKTTMCSMMFAMCHVDGPWLGHKFPSTEPGKSNLGDRGIVGLRCLSYTPIM